jgi:hypothetical protein
MAQEAWLEPLLVLAQDLGGWGPKILAALVVLCVGLLGAYILRALAEAFSRAIKMDVRLKDLWLFRLWTARLHGHQPSQSLGAFVFYFCLFLTVLLAIRVMGVEASQGILSALLGVVPRVLSFMLILFLGALLAMFLSAVAQVGLAGSGVQHPVFWGKVIAWGTFGLTVVFSLEPLGLAGRLVTEILLILLAALCLAAALSFGLGCKDLAREFLIEVLKDSNSEER